MYNDLLWLLFVTSILSLIASLCIVVYYVLNTTSRTYMLKIIIMINMMDSGINILYIVNNFIILNNNDYIIS